MHVAPPTPASLERHKRRRELRQTCTKFLSGHGTASPSSEAAEVARFCEERNVDADLYGTGNFLQSFEKEIAKLMGFEAALFLPTGVMAQQIAMRIHCEARASKNIAFHPTCHLEENEEHAYAFLHGLRATLLGNKVLPFTFEDVANCPEELAALIVELPLRRLGGILPSWDELSKIKSIARVRNIQLHLDGARLWESQAHYQRSFAEICRGFESVYLSFYKGIGAIAGSMLCGSSEFIAKARVWQRRHGGNIHQLFPYAVSSKLNFDKRIEKFSGYRKRAIAIAEELRSIKILTLRPERPQTNMMHVFLPYPVATLEAARDQIALNEKFWIAAGFFVADTPNSSFLELTVGDSTMALASGDVKAIFTKFIEICEAI